MSHYEITIVDIEQGIFDLNYNRREYQNIGLNKLGSEVHFSIILFFFS
jgi:hypothetical protein